MLFHGATNAYLLNLLHVWCSFTLRNSYYNYLIIKGIHKLCVYDNGTLYGQTCRLVFLTMRCLALRDKLYTFY